MIAWIAGCALAAETWWVPDQATADALAAAAATDWPGEEHRVMVGVRPVGSVGWSWDGHALTRSLPGEVRTADAADPHVAVLLGRTWAMAAPTPAAPEYLPEAPIALPASDVVSPPVLDHSRWAMTVRLGTRTSAAEPFPLQGVRAGLGLEKGHVWTAVEAYGAIAPFDRLFAAGGSTVDTADVDMFALGADAGWRGTGRIYVFGLVNPQLRHTRSFLLADDAPQSSFDGVYGAVALGGGAGFDARHFRAELGGWARLTYGLPPTVGVALDGAWVVFGARRKDTLDPG